MNKLKISFAKRAAALALAVLMMMSSSGINALAADEQVLPVSTGEEQGGPEGGAPAGEPETPTEEPPAEQPTDPPATETPTAAPTEAPTEEPAAVPTEAPTQAPTEAPTAAPTEQPSAAPTASPSAAPTPSASPSVSPSASPSASPKAPPAANALLGATPSASPSAAPTAEEKVSAPAGDGTNNGLGAVNPLAEISLNVATGGSDGATPSAGEYTVVFCDADGNPLPENTLIDRDDTIRIKMNYNLNNVVKNQSIDGNTIIKYEFPSTIKISDVASSPILDADNGYTQRGVYYVQQNAAGNSELCFQYNSDYLIEKSNIKGDFYFECNFLKSHWENEDDVVIDFGGSGTTVPIKFNDSDIVGKKVYTVNADGTVDFTITLTPDAISHKVTLVDTLGTAFAFQNPAGFKLDGNPVSASVNGQVAMLDIGDLAAGAHTITYKATIVSSDSSAVRTNTAKWSWGNEPHTRDTSVTVDWNTGSAIDKTGSFDAANRQINWVVTVNDTTPKMDLGGAVLTDLITSTKEGAPVQTLKGNITVQRKETNGNWASYATLTQWEDGGKYTFAQDAGTYVYKFTYATAFDETGVANGDYPYKNTATLDKGNIHIHDDADVTWKINKSGTGISIPFYKELKHASPNASDNSFKFELWKADENYTAQGAKALQTKNINKMAAGSKSAWFDKIKYTEGGTYYYIVKEVAGTVPGMDYDETVYQVKVVVTDQGNTLKVANPVITKAGGGTGPINFTNNYTYQEIEVKLGANKTVNGAAPGGDYEQFTFYLCAADEHFGVKGDVIESAKNDKKTGAISFKALTYNNEDIGKTYNYVIYEKTGTTKGYVYDTTRYCVSVKITADPVTGGPKATVTYMNSTGGVITGTPTFNNTYSKYDWDTEDGIGVGVKTYDKVLKGSDFSFKVVGQKGSQAEGTSYTVENDANGKIDFGTITFTKPGTYIYTITEVNDGAANVVYDKTEYTVTVDVTMDSTTHVLTVGEPVIKAGNKTVTQIVFKNSYAAVDFTITGKKTVETNVSNFTPSGYSFIMEGVAGSKAEGQTFTNAVSDAEGVFSWKDIPFKAEGTYVYKVTEKTGTDTNVVTYDHSAYYVTITVTKQDGKLAAALTSIRKDNQTTGQPVDSIVFTNTKFQVTGIHLPLPIKQLTGRAPVANEFTIMIRAVEGPDGFPLGSNKYTRKILSNGTFQPIPALTLNLPGDYVYEYAETKGSDQTITYDTTKYYVTFSVTKEGNTLKATTPVIHKDNKAGPIVGESELIFRNSYNEDQEPPDVNLDKAITKAYLDGTINWESTIKMDHIKQGQMTEFTYKDSYSATATNAYGVSLPTSLVANSLHVYQGETMLTEGADYAVAYDSNKFAITFKAEFLSKLSGTPTLKVAYSTKTNNLETLPAAGKGTVKNGASIDYKHGNVTGHKDDSESHDYGHMLEKTSLSYDAATGVAKWKIRLNGSGVDIGKAILNVVDTLPDGMEYVANSALVYKQISGQSSGTRVEPSISADKKTLTWNITGQNSAVLELDFSTKLTAVDENTGSLSQTYTNKATLNSDGVKVGDDTADVTVTFKVLDKAAQLIGNGGAYQVAYTLSVNPQGLDLLPSGDTLSLTDNLPAGASFIVQSIKVLDGNTNKALDKSKYNLIYTPDTEKPTLQISLPDKQYIKVQYTLVPKGTVGTTVTLDNDAKLVGYDQIKTHTSNEFKIVNSSASTTGEAGYVRLQKSTEGAVALQGATFQLYRVDIADGADSVRETQIDEQTTPANGIIKFETDGNGKLGQDVLYYYVETQAPEGYQSSTAKHYFVLPGNNVDTLKALIAQCTVPGGKLEGVTVDYSITQGGLFNVANTAYSAVVDLKAVKMMDGSAASTRGQFSFVMTNDDGGTQVGSTAVNTATGVVNFDTIRYTYGDVGKTFNYTVSEVIPQGDTSIDYDKTTYQVQVQVGFDDENDCMTTAVTVDGTAYTGDVLGDSGKTPLVFKNYTHVDEVELSINAYKTLQNKNITEGMFTFHLFGEGESIVATNDANGKIIFTGLQYTTVGEHDYTIKEVTPADPLDGVTFVEGVTYTDATYKVHVSVTKVDNTLNAAVTSITGGPATDEVRFTNTYKAQYQITALKTLTDLSNTGKTREDFKPFSFVVEDASGNVLRTADNATDGTVTFAPFEYTEENTYTYYVRESIPTAEDRVQGITYDTTRYKVTVTTRLNATTGLLEATGVIEDHDAIAFENTYQAAETEFGIVVNKTLTGKTLAADQFTFEMAGDGIEGTLTARNDANGKVSFPAQHYTATGDYTYTITEQVPQAAIDNGYVLNGMTYSQQSTTVIVHVADVNGELQATATVGDEAYTENGIVFTNDYKAAETDFTIKGIKAFEDQSGSGMTLNAGDYQFLLKEGENEIETVANDENGNITFAALHYDTEGTHDYTITEVPGTVADIHYDSKVYTVHVEVKDVDGQLTATATMNDVNGAAYTEPAQITFTNTYSTQAQFAIKGSKGMEDVSGSGRAVQAGEFSFQLTGYNITDPIIVTNDAQGNVSFPVQNYTGAGDYNYTVTEVIPAAADKLPGITYDETSYAVVVHVGEGATPGTLTATATVDGAAYAEDSILFTNSYSAETEFGITATKTVEGMTLQPEQYSFVLTGGELTEPVIVKNDANGNVTFPVQKYTHADTYTYTVTEQIPADADKAPGVTYDEQSYTVIVNVTGANGALTATATVNENPYDETPITFHNTYKATETEFAVRGIKAFEDKSGSGKTLNAGDYQFVLKEGEQVLETVANDENGNITFAALRYDTEGSHDYTITEVPGTATGIHYDAAVYTVHVEVKDVNARLVATATMNDVNGDAYTEPEQIKFTNSYQATKTGFTIKGIKTFEANTDKTLAAGDYSFTLTEKGETEPLQTKKNAADGSITFDAIEYTTVSQHDYVIAELDTGATGVTYDPITYAVHVDVADVDGALQATATVNETTGYTDDAIRFSNTYKATDATLELNATKILTDENNTGKTLARGEFSFTLAGDTLAEPAVVKNGADETKDVGHVAFPVLTYDQEGTFHYTITEQTTSVEAGITPDTSVYNVTVVVKDQSGQLVATPTIIKDGAKVEPDAIRFTNKYKAGSVGFAIEANKALTGKDAMTAGEFSFTLTEDAANNPKTMTAPQQKTNNINGSIAFDSITYEAAGDYKYTITEDQMNPATQKAEPGITYDPSTYTVTVHVADDNAQLTAAVSSIVRVNGEETTNPDTVTFENGYTVEDTEIALAANKVLMGKDEALELADNTYSFELHELGVGEDGAPTDTILQTVQNGTDAGDPAHNVHFAAIPYVYDETLYTAENNYTQIFNYEVKEVIPAPDSEAYNSGIHYDDTVYTATVTVQDVGGKLEASVAYALADGTKAEGMTFTNTQMETSTHFEADKYYYGTGDFDAESFHFTLNSADAQGNIKEGTAAEPVDGKTVDNGTDPIPAQTVGMSEMTETTGKITFGDITYDKAGIYNYVISEDGAQSATGNLMMDASRYLVTVNVTRVEDATGTRLEIDPETGITYTWLYEGLAPEQQEDVAFYNNEVMFYNMAANMTTVPGKKVLLDADGNAAAMTAGQFRFDLYSGGEIIATATNDENGDFNFNVSYFEPGSFTYQAKEQNAGLVIDGIAYDPNTYDVTVTVDENMNATVSGMPTFTNTGATQVSVTKVWDDAEHEDTRPQSVTANLYANGDTEHPVQTTELNAANNWTTTYANLALRGADGEKITYTVDETPIDGYVAAVVSDGANNYTITNTYNAAANVFYTPQVNKELIGREGIPMTAGEFSFELADAEGKVLATGTNDENGVVAFPTMGYTAPGVTNYTITEKAGTDSHISYDARTISLSVTVTEQDGVLSAEAAYTDLATGGELNTFTNAYRSVIVRVRKTSRDGSGDALAGAVYGLWMVNEQGGADAYIGSATSGADGYMTFTSIIPGARYYFKEESAPVGHTVEEYKSETFRVVAGDGTYTLAYEGEAGYEAAVTTFNADAPLAQSTEPIELEAKGVSDEVTKLNVAKLDKNTHEYISGATMQIIEKNSGAVVLQWTTGGSAQYIERQLNVDVHYILREAVAPSGYELAADTEFSFDAYGNMTVYSGGDAEWVGDTTLNIYDAKAATTVTNTEYKEDTTIVDRIIHRIPQTSDDMPIALIAMTMLDSLLALAYVGLRKRNHK